MERIREFLGTWVRRGFSPILAALQRLGVTPNQISIVGFLVNVGAAVLILFDYYIWAASVFIVAGLLDLVDGSLARRTGKSTPFGSFLDSTLDRMSEGVIFAAIAYRLALDQRSVDVALVVLALLGSVTVSYTRARAESLGVECKVGLMSRPERVILIALGLFFNVLPYVIYIMLALTAFTVIQRVVHTYRQLIRQREQGGSVE
jgi:CDP-diacylglycerol--glycerol-3-phosphate 3-phosphatidyltransferase